VEGPATAGDGGGRIAVVFLVLAGLARGGGVTAVEGPATGDRLVPDGFEGV
jgi:hypothetical protein